jgi:hypothetical protein
MITSYLQGGLGNQMFQIATTVSLAKRNSDEAVFSMKNHYLPGQGRGVSNYVNNIFRNVEFKEELPPLNIYQEPHFHYREVPYIPNICLLGYFQSEKYFKEHEDHIRDIFSPDEECVRLIKQKYSDLLSRTPVAIHVRRGDYLSAPLTHPIPPMEYFRKSMNHYEKDTTFLIFSDDIAWCRKSFKGENIFFIENNSDYIDLYLISLCRGVIISNSSFSWWGAWLNINSSKVIISPKKWFGPAANCDSRDLIPPEWRTI